MGLSTPPGPPIEALRLGLDSVVGGSTSLRTALDLEPGILKALTPLRLFRLNCEEFLAKPLSHDAAGSGWLYVVFSNGKPAALAELSPKGDDFEVSRVTVDESAELSTIGEFYRAFQIAAAWASAAHGNYEIRLLEIPAIHIRALWLVGPAAPECDYLVLAPPAPRNFQPCQEYEAGQFIEAVSPLCQYALKVFLQRAAVQSQETR